MKILKVLIFISLLTIVIAGCANTNKTQDTKKILDTDLKNYTNEDVSKHNNANDCWMIIEDKVYNVTDFVNSHPGGKAILEGCGQDATELFNTRPMGSGTKHSKKAQNLLQNYYLGNLTK